MKRLVSVWRDSQPLAEVYPTDEQLGNAIAQFKSWYQIVQRGLSVQTDVSPDESRMLSATIAVTLAAGAISLYPFLERVERSR